MQAVLGKWLQHAARLVHLEGQWEVLVGLMSDCRIVLQLLRNQMVVTQGGAIWNRRTRDEIVARWTAKICLA